MGLQGCKAGNVLEDVVDHLGVAGDDISVVLEVRLWRLFEDLGKGSLDQGTGSDDLLRKGDHSILDVVQDTESVVDDEPAQSPAGNHPSLGETIAGNNGHLRGQAGDGMELSSSIDQVTIDLISDDGHVVALGNLKRGN